MRFGSDSYSAKRALEAHRRVRNAAGAESARVEVTIDFGGQSAVEALDLLHLTASADDGQEIVVLRIEARLRGGENGKAVGGRDVRVDVETARVALQLDMDDAGARGENFTRETGTVGQRDIATIKHGDILVFFELTQTRDRIASLRKPMHNQSRSHSHGELRPDQIISRCRVLKFILSLREWTRKRLEAVFLLGLISWVDTYKLEK